MPIRAAQGRPNQDPNQAQLCGHAYSPALNASPRLCLTSQLELARVVMVSAPRPPGGGLDSLEALHAELVQLELDASELGEDALPVERLNERLPPGVADLVAGARWGGAGRRWADDAGWKARGRGGARPGKANGRREGEWTCSASAERAWKRERGGEGEGEAGEGEQKH